MSYLTLRNLGQDPAQPAATAQPAAVDKQEARKLAGKLFDKPFPEPETAPGSDATAQPPAPAIEDIEAIHRQIKDEVGNKILDELSFKMNAVCKSFNRDVQKSLITTGAIDTGVGLILACAGPVGWVAGLLLVVVRGVIGTQFAKEAQVIMAETQAEASKMQAIWDAKIQQEQAAVIEQETPAAIKLAIDLALGDELPIPATTGAPMEGLGSLGNIAAVLMLAAAKKQQEFNQSLETMTPEQRAAAEAERKRKLALVTAVYLGANPQAQKQLANAWERTITSLQEKLGMKEPAKDYNAAEKVYHEARNIIKEYGFSTLLYAVSPPIAVASAAVPEVRAKVNAWGPGAIDIVSGHIVVTKAKEASRLILEQARLKIIAQYTIAKKQMEDPAFRAQVRLAIAEQILQNPEIQKILAGIVLAKEQLGDRPVVLEPQAIPAIRQSPLPPKPNTALLAGGGIAAALAAWFMLR